MNFNRESVKPYSMKDLKLSPEAFLLGGILLDIGENILVSVFYVDSFKQMENSPRIV